MRLLEAVEQIDDPARRERLRQLANRRGVVAGLAIDHRDAFRAAFARGGQALPDEATLRALKTHLVRGLAGRATMVLLDAEYGLDAIRAGAVPPHVALVMPLERQGYEGADPLRLTELLTDFSPRDAGELGAAGCKLLLPFRPDDPDSSLRQEEIAAATAERCHAASLPLILEPLVQRHASEAPDAFVDAFADLVVETAGRLAHRGADLLKVQYPGSPDGCRRLAAACGSVPWVLLGGGAEPAVLAAQVEQAGRAGGSGVIVGRSVWAAAVTADLEAADRAIVGTCAPAFDDLRAAAEAAAG